MAAWDSDPSMTTADPRMARTAMMMAAVILVLDSTAVELMKFTNGSRGGYLGSDFLGRDPTSLCSETDFKRPKNKKWKNRKGV